MKPVSPVFDDTTSLEVVLGASQEEYTNLPVIVGMGRVSCRMEFEDDERAAIANGADVIITVLNFGKPLQPLAFMVATKGDIMGNKEMREHLGIFSTLDAASQLEVLMKQLGGTTSLADIAKAERVIRMCRALEARSKEMSKFVHEMEALENSVKGRISNIVAYALKEAMRFMEYTSDAEMLEKIAESYILGDMEIPDDVSKSL